MPLPFTRDQFFDVFAAYNTALWPFAVLLWMLSLGLVVRLMRSVPPLGASVAWLLALHWAWSALAYHFAFFAGVNPAAPLFAVLFLFQAAMFLWWGIVRRALRFRWQHSPRHAVAALVLAYGLLYPLLVAASGHRYPAMPTFGVPCPTTMLTIGLLLFLEPRVPWSLAVIPLVWAAIGGSAALLFGVQADFALLVAGCVLAYDLICATTQGRGEGALPG